jgi:transcriptional regulator with XRE-family HTH domain
MRIDQNNTDQTILNEIGERIATLRLNRNLTQAELAEQSGVSKRTVERLESGEGVQTTSLIRLFRSLGLLPRFETLIPEPVPSPVAQLKLHGGTRRRASSTKKAGAPAQKWKWGNEE